MAYRIIWSPKAAAHLEGICEYIAQDSRQYAVIFAQQILRLVRLIADFPRSGRVVPEYNNVCLREKIHGNYRIVYRIKASETVVEVAAICHSARQVRNVIVEDD